MQRSTRNERQKPEAKCRRTEVGKDSILPCQHPSTAIHYPTSGFTQEFPVGPAALAGNSPVMATFPDRIVSTRGRDLKLLIETRARNSETQDRKTVILWTKMR